MGGLFDLTGKVVLATGGASGIGLGFLQGCARQGASVVVLDRHDAAAHAAIPLLEGCGAPRVHVEIADVAEEAQVTAAFSSALAALGRIDCVFANAGINLRAPSFSELTAETVVSKGLHRLAAGLADR